MFRYSAFALCIHSEIELPDLPPGGSEPDVAIRFGSVSRTPRQASLDEEIAIHTLAGAFQISHGREITIDPLPGADPALLRVLVAGRMMAFLLRQRGWLPLHASGVELNGEAILFLGASGSGKSTTAAVFYARGHQVLTDDVGAIRVALGGHCLLRPAGSRLRLFADSQAVFDGIEPRWKPQWDKRLFDLARTELRELLRVRKIFLLQDGDKLRMEIIPTLAAVTALSRNSFVKHWRMNKEALAAHLRDCASIAGAVPVYQLTRPRSLAALPELARGIEREMEKEASSV